MNSTISIIAESGSQHVTVCPGQPAASGLGVEFAGVEFEYDLCLSDYGTLSLAIEGAFVDPAKPSIE